MKTVFWVAALLGLVNTGCVWDHNSVCAPDKKPPTETMVAKQPPPRPHVPAVRPEDANDDNGRQIAQALLEEIEEDKARGVVAADTANGQRSAASPKTPAADR